METKKERLIGSRLGDFIRDGIKKIPNNGVTQGIGTALKIVDANVNRNPLTRLYSKAEDLLINKGSELAAKHLKIDPTIAGMGIGLAIPGPAGEVNTGKRLLKTKNVLNTAKSPLWKRMSANKQFLATHGESWEDAIKFMESGYEHWGKKIVKNGNGNGTTGTLKGIEGGRYWINPSTGKSYKLKPTVTSNKVSSLNMTGISLKDDAVQQASKFKRDRVTKVNAKKVNEIVAKMGGTPDQAKAYIQMNKLEKKALTEYIAKLNKKAGSTQVSLGHKAAAERFEHSADIANNLKIERLRTTEKGGLGNAARSNKAEIADDLNTALNGSFSLEEDIAKFLDPTVGAFWVGMSNSQKKQMMDLVNKGMDMDDALDKVGFGKTVLGSSRDSMKIRRY